MNTVDDLIKAIDGVGDTIANAITPIGVSAGKDAIGGHVGSLTEAVMGMTAAMVEIASALSLIASAIETRDELP